ncbi:enoyl-CoA hydratase/isomerase family protein [Halorientalis halophila]|uniref:enoyl-CoA hydratase/isomerase family protein n=1 Tax=Halorientalis halophila TaxID=3108499 RepID=UPI003008703B
MASYETLRVDRDDGIATVTLDTNADRNGVTMKLTDDLVSLAAAVGEDPDVRCLVLTHEGPFFSVGADLSEFAGDASDATYLREIAGRLHEAIVQFHQAEVPILGAIDGIAAGSGFSMAVLPDIVLLSEDARLEYAYPRIGLSGDGGATYFLPRLLGLRKAQEIVLLDEPIDPDDALEMGLATDVVPTDEFAARRDELARSLAAGPTEALGKNKRLMAESFDTSLESQLAAETEALADVAKTDDFARGYAAFFEDDDPEFTGQ